MTPQNSNWRTTTGGLLIALGQAMIISPDPRIQWLGHGATALGAIILGTFARDRDHRP